MNRFGRSLRFCYPKLDNEAISDGCRSEIAPYRWGVFNYKVDLRELNFCDPCGPYFFIQINNYENKLYLQGQKFNTQQRFNNSFN